MVIVGRESFYLLDSALGFGQQQLSSHLTALMSRQNYPDNLIHVILPVFTDARHSGERSGCMHCIPHLIQTNAIETVREALVRSLVDI